MKRKPHKIDKSDLWLIHNVHNEPLVIYFKEVVSGSAIKSEKIRYKTHYEIHGKYPNRSALPYSSFLFLITDHNELQKYLEENNLL